MVQLLKNSSHCFVNFVLFVCLTCMCFLCAVCVCFSCVYTCPRVSIWMIDWLIDWPSYILAVRKCSHCTSASNWRLPLLCSSLLQETSSLINLEKTVTIFCNILFFVVLQSRPRLMPWQIIPNLTYTTVSHNAMQYVVLYHGAYRSSRCLANARVLINVFSIMLAHSCVLGPEVAYC